MLLFVNTTCMTCKSILSDMHQHISNDDTNSFSSMAMNKEMMDCLQLPPDHAVYVRSSQIMELYGVTVVPQAILIDEHGIILQRKSCSKCETV
ncbi:hypothetical protein ACEQPO_27245 [Bacillus sp. SL00103]